MTATVDTAVIGAGHAGLAVSHLLARAGHDHVVLDRGRVGESWRSRRWDSLRLITPRWMVRLPGWRYEARGGAEGFMPAGELVQHLERYARLSDAPLELGREVVEVSTAGDGYRVVTDQRTWQARQVVIATGTEGRPVLPEGLDGLAGDIRRLPALDYRNPGQLPPGGVLVVGGSASGAQIADELARAGRRVVLSVGRHTRVPRRYRGWDLYWWLEQTGRLARPADPARGRHEPSLQLAPREPGDRRGADLDLLALRDAGVELVGRARSFDGHRVRFAADLDESTRAADRWLWQFLAEVDRFVDGHGLERELDPASRPEPVRLPPPRRSLDLRKEGIGTVVVATGHRPHHPWLKVPVHGPDGAIRQVRGATPAPGLYVVGQPWQHRRDSATIDGARFNALDVAVRLCASDGRALRARGPR